MFGDANDNNNDKVSLVTATYTSGGSVGFKFGTFLVELAGNLSQLFLLCLLFLCELEYEHYLITRDAFV